MAETIKQAVNRFLGSTQRFSEVAPLVANNESDAKEIACLAGMFRDEMQVLMRTALRTGNTNASPSKEIFHALDKMDALLDHVEDSITFYQDDAIQFSESTFANILRNLNAQQLDEVLDTLPGIDTPPLGLVGKKRQKFIDNLIKQQAEGSREHKQLGNQLISYNTMSRMVHGLRWLPSKEAIKRWKALGLPVLLAILSALGIPIPEGLSAVPGEMKLQVIDNFLDGLGILFPGKGSGNCEITITAKSVELSASPDAVEDWGEIVIQFEVDGTSKRWPETGFYEPGGANFSLADTEIGKLTKPGCAAHSFVIKAKFIDQDRSFIPFDEDDSGVNQKTVTINCGDKDSTHELEVKVYEGGDTSDNSPITATIKFEVSSECKTTGKGTSTRAG
jgi:hypothetical protein